SDNTQAVADNTQQVSLDTAQVAQDKQVVEAARAEVESNTTIASDAAVTATAQATIATDAVSKIGDVTGGMVVNRLDANGNQNVMVKIPVMTNKIFNDALGTSWEPESAPHPAFIRPDGTTMPWFEFGMYQASNDGNGNPVSASHKDPYTSVNFDEAKAKCQAMGVGWGMTSNAQWAAIALWCLANGYQPLGNTYYGYSHERSYLGGIRQDGGINGGINGIARILTGSGSVEFRHNKIMQGISDMVGNTWEWEDGIKSVGGQIFVATRERQDEAEWEAQSAYLDDGNKLNSEITGTTNTSVTWSSLGKSETYITNQLLQQLMIEPIAETGGALGELYYNNDGERLPLRGGSWSTTSIAGVAALHLSSSRASLSTNSRGFRPAYFE
ncbi:hypothetical protein, partial [Vibrio casei]|uniref:hypothetical protein n=1 Tax=Vibrio casei TaxID=673372 RepID=UPI003F9EB288